MRLLTPKEVGEILGVSEDKLRRLRAKKEGPPFIKIGGSVRYDRAKLQEWIDREHEGDG